MDHFGVAVSARASVGEEDLSSALVLDQALALVFVAGRIADVVVAWAAGGGRFSPI